MSDRIIVITPDELRTLIREEIGHALESGAKAEPQGDIMSLQGVAELLDVHPRTIKKMVEEGLPELRRIGDLRRFSRAAVLEYMKKAPAH